MSFDRDDFERLKQEAMRAQAEKIAPQLQMLKQGAVVGEMMTGVPAWDSYLSYLQGAIETTEKQLAALQNAINAPDNLDPASLLKIKVDVLRCNERIHAWQAAMQLPKELIERGEQAENLLAKMDSIDAYD